MQQWHLDVQHELPDHTVMTVSYVGSKGTISGVNATLTSCTRCLRQTIRIKPGEAIECRSTRNIAIGLTNIGDPSVTGRRNGDTITGQAAINLQTACANDPNPYPPVLRDWQPSPAWRITRPPSTMRCKFQARKNVGALSLTVAYTYSHSIDDSSDRYDGSFVNSYDPSLNRASSNFDQRHMLNIGYVYDLPFFRKPGMTRTLLGGWEWSGIIAILDGNYR